MANILVTGGSGLIGWCAAEQLTQQGHDVVVFDLKPNHENLATLQDKLTIVSGDVTDLPKILSTMKRHRIDHVLHLAAFIADQSALDPAGAFKINTIGTANIFDAAMALDVKRVVWTSSVTALAVADDYDNHPIDELYQVISREPYGASKHACEVLADRYKSNFDLDVVGIRPALTYGMGRLSGGTGTFNSAIRKMALGEKTGVLSSMTLHQAMYNRDMAALLIAALLGKKPQHHIFNTPVERNYTNDELIRVLYRVCPDAEIYLDAIPSYIPKVPVMDGSRARREIDFTPRYSLEDGVREMVDLFRGQQS